MGSVFRSTKMEQSKYIICMVLLLLPSPTPAPTPPCSPFILLNKIVESNNLSPDANPYYPVPPCEYGGPLEAISAGDLRSVFFLADPKKAFRHVKYEQVFILNTGLPRLMDVLLGKKELIVDENIRNEGYQHYTKYPRTTQFGRGTRRRPEIIDNEAIYNTVLRRQLRQRQNQNQYTPQGPLR